MVMDYRRRKQAELKSIRRSNRKAAEDARRPAETFAPQRPQRPHASSWQIAGVWIAPAALLLTAARTVADLWQILGL
jgi:hypothetical protein